MTKNISEEIIEKIKKLPETHKQEIENIGLVLENMKKEYFNKIPSPVAREIEEHRFSFILKDIKLSNLIPFYRATLKNGVLFWDYQNNKAGIHFNEFYRLFDDFFPDTETKEEFFKFEFSFDDPEVFKENGFSLFYNIEDENFSIYPISGKTVKITDEKMVFKTDSFAITTTMPREFLFIKSKDVESYIVGSALSTCSRVEELIEINNETKEEYIRNIPVHLSDIADRLEINCFINKGLMSSRGIFPYSLLKEDQEESNRLMKIVKMVNPHILSQIVSKTNEMIDVFL